MARDYGHSSGTVECGAHDIPVDPAVIFCYDRGDRMTEETNKNTIDSVVDAKVENPLRVGICSLDELEERIKAFRTMNQTALKKRYIVAREDIRSHETAEIVVKKGTELDLSGARLLRRHMRGYDMVPIVQPDEGIVIISDMSTPEGIGLSMDLVTQVMNLGGGKYDNMLDRIDSFSDFLHMMKRTLFPRLIIIGYLSVDRQEMEKINFVRARRFDQYVRAIEVTHYMIKQRPYFPRIKQVHIDASTQTSWKRFVLEVIREYTKPYFVEEY